ISVDASVTQKVGFTLAFWMQAFDNGVIFNESVNDAYFSVYREDDLFVEFSDGLNVTSVSFGVDTEWKHVAVVYHPGDGLDLYIDAVLVASNSTLVDPFISEQRIIGSLNVLLDDMYIWQRQIDLNEIKSMYYRALQ
ncbi:MAG: LamG-like jellyroll fold domain-containing protein, partial [Candidatus Woesearchaeota archaeon]